MTKAQAKRPPKAPAPKKGYRGQALIAEDEPIPRSAEIRGYRRRDMRASSSRKR